MNRVLILYPKLFTCYTKFSRKVLRIIQNMGDFEIVYQEDTNDFIKNLCLENLQGIKISKNDSWQFLDLTHAIIFDDGEEFTKETDLLLTANIPLRIIKIAITRVVNIKKEIYYQSLKSIPTYQYIGRGSYWGNPYSMLEDGDDRAEVIRKFKYDFDFEKFANKKKSEVFKLSGKRLGCFCKPEPCHGDVLADFLNSWDDGK
ncbi:MAG: DUF4326 domain-containing protein [Methylococcales bacterium]|nr:MAG: DUF4326 domain-containing protein [Methylococcales bacterium]